MNIARVSAALLATSALTLACTSANPAAAEYSSSSSSGGITTPTDDGDASSDEDARAETSDAGNDALDAADSFDGFYPPPPSKCDPEMTIGSSVALPGSVTGGRFAGITRDELTVAWTVTTESKTSLHVSDRETTSDGFGAPQTVTTDIATDSVAITSDGLELYAVAPDHRSFVVYTRADRYSDFEVGDDTSFDRVIEALGPTELLGDPVFINSGVALLYSVYGGTSMDTMRLGTRISIYADWYPAYTLAFNEFRQQGSSRRRPTGTGDDFQVIFYWDEVSQTEKLARLNGTEMILNVHDLGARPWAQPNKSCNTVYFGAIDIVSAPSH